MRTTANLLLLAALAAAASAQTPVEPRPMPPIPVQSDAKIDAVDAPPTAASARPARDHALRSTGAVKPFEADRRTPAPPIDQLHWTVTRDGAHWALGATYKAGFGAGGATYVPFLGSDAPRNFPLELSLAAATVDGRAIELLPATSAVRDGDRVVIDRGPIDEVYELGLDSLEQTFVVGERPASGDLRLFVRLQSEMARSETADGLRFSNEHGAVGYGRAFVREPDGRRTAVESRAVEGGVEIVVGRDYLAGASFPLVVDPVVTTFDVDTITADHVESDVSYDLSTDRWLVAYERVFSATDGDIEIQLRNGNGTGIAVNYVDNTGQDWRSPQTANVNSANQFLCVCQVVGYPGVPGSNIVGVTVDAINMGQGWPLLISTTDQTGDKVLADVGGDPFDGTAYYCVVWRRNFTASDYDIHARLVRPDSTLVGTSTILIDNSGSSKDSWPSVSKSNGILGGAAAWTIAWHREISATNVDIRAARMSYSGTILNPSASIASSSLVEAYPRASSPLDDGRALVAYAVDYGDNDIEYALLDGTTVLASGSLTQLDSPANLLQEQIEYSVDSDGQRFVLAYAEQFSTSTFDYDIYASTFLPGGTGLVCPEAHQVLDYSGQQALRTDVVAKHSGGALNSRRCYVSWDTTTTSNAHDIRGGLYDVALTGYEPFCPGDGSVVACPCANEGSSNAGCGNSVNGNGASLTATGHASVSSDTLAMTVAGVPANVTCTLFQGTSTSAFVFGDGVRCVTGTLRRIRTKSASATGVATWPTGSESDISVTGNVPAAGALRHYQVTYRNSAFFCTPATFNISNGMSVQWQP